MAEIKHPEFADNGKTIDSLKKVYNCESVDFENWENKKATDSCLTVRLINSSKVPKSYNVDESVNQFKAIALAINKSLVKPQNYKSFYIIFVEKDKDNVTGLKMEAHSAGMKIRRAEL